MFQVPCGDAGTGTPAGKVSVDSIFVLFFFFLQIYVCVPAACDLCVCFFKNCHTKQTCRLF